jgi:hypothetical protein
MALEGSITPAGGPATAPTPSVGKVVFGNAEAPPVVPPPAPEPKAEEKAPEPVKEVESWRLAALSQKEKAIRESAAQAKADRAAAQAEREAVQRERQAWAERQSIYRQNPLQLLQDHGFDYDGVTRFVAQGGWSPEQQAAAQQAAQIQAINELARRQEADRQAFIAQREADLKAAQEREEQERTQAEQEAVTEFKEELSSFVKAEPDAYEMIGLAGQGAMDAIFARIEEHYQKTGERLSNKAAADAVEAELIAEAEKVINASKKLKGKFAPPPAPPPPTTRTLTNAMKPPVAPPPTGHTESEQERRARVTRQIEQAWGRR